MTGIRIEKTIRIFLVLISMWLGAVFAAEGTDNAELTQTINYLLAFVGNSECTFIRNDKEHSAEKAAAHMKQKYQHFKDRISTPEDFIRLAATKSLVSNKPYLVKTKSGSVIESGTWLLQALEVYREAQKR